MKVTKVSYDHIHQFSKRDHQYTQESESFGEFIQYPFEYEAFSAVLADRQKYPIDRALLKRVVISQYAGLKISKATQRHLDSMEDSNFFTVTTAHQPSLLTGPLYYVFKILSSIRLAQRLSEDFPSYKVAPVFVIGGEDHDFEEINHLHLYGKQIAWKNDGKGSVGRFDTAGLSAVLTEVGDILGKDAKTAELLKELNEHLNQSKSYGEFSFRMTHTLFDELGLIILRMDEPELKAAFSDHIQKELTQELSADYVRKTQAKIKDCLLYTSPSPRDS